MVMDPPSAMTYAPNITRQPGPTVTLPQMTALGATQAVESIRGETPSCLMSMWFSWVLEEHLTLYILNHVTR
jgi:hypothetical protein